ncbi:rhodanese-like domain-containing protein [Pelodictyon luteolum]|uniref:Rhodanese-like protein n=1 Tax=Chlorobium luteolum (strain DSM 273 / BCRC 81028 / 2530) TaxID=319225 RepID=Q3B6V9_CHLL3|nr:rhodanese-like domain-containing protein [Pelodictyon luteolum]ABB22922.1 Rhodanese-like protein [Pelodictyon luteolum DSM 273]
MTTLSELVEECLPDVQEIMPWHLVERMAGVPGLLIVDVREPYEFEAMHIEGSVCVPRGILEAACEWGYEDTLPELAAGRDREIVVVCRSGRRSVLAAYAMQRLGFLNVRSLRTGLRGWNDYDEPLVDADGAVVGTNDADSFFLSRLRPDQMPPKAGN